jgi:hypothetical protein
VKRVGSERVAPALTLPEREALGRPRGERRGQVLNRRNAQGGEDIIVVVHDDNSDPDRNTTLDDAVLIATFGPNDVPGECGKGVIVPALSKQDPYREKQQYERADPAYDDAGDTGREVRHALGLGETTEETICRCVDEWNARGHCYQRPNECDDFVHYLLSGFESHATGSTHDFPPLRKK